MIVITISAHHVTLAVLLVAGVQALVLAASIVWTVTRAVRRRRKPAACLQGLRGEKLASRLAEGVTDTEAPGRGMPRAGTSPRRPGASPRLDLKDQ